MKRRMGNPEYFDLICLVHKHWNFLADFYTRGVANVVGQQEYEAIKALSGSGILDQRLEVSANWRKAISDVSNGRPVFQLSDGEKRRVVDVWHNAEFA